MKDKEEIFMWFKKSTVAFAGTVTAGILFFTPMIVRADVFRGDFALLDQEPTVADLSVQCGATVGNSRNPQPGAFTMNITMTNRTDLGGAAGFVRVNYADGNFVDYAIPVDTTLNMNIAGGGTPGVDESLRSLTAPAPRSSSDRSIY
ncbi:MAG TPA: hypothetical protein VHS07_03480 [Candidatus Binataceae bacterium]|nr:hypothetical protein [Candidatus Binataceae bacterium]